MSKFDVADEILANTQRDLSDLEAMADGYYLVRDAFARAPSLGDAMIDEANRHLRDKLGDSILFFCGIYAVESASVLYEFRLLGTAKAVIDTPFLDSPLDMGKPDKVWHANGLGLVVETHDEILEEIEMPLEELSGWGSMWPELTIPINQNMIFAANPLLGPPPKDN